VKKTTVKKSKINDYLFIVGGVMTMSGMITMIVVGLLFLITQLIILNYLSLFGFLWGGIGIIIWVISYKFEKVNSK